MHCSSTGKVINFEYSNSAVVAISCLKVALIIFISMALDDWWTYGSDSSDSRNNEIVESCSNTDENQCYSFCPGNIEIIDIRVTDDLAGIHYSLYPYCIANLPGSCAYKYWLIFRLVPLLAQVFVLLLQCWCLYKYKEFTPQEVQYGVISQYLFPIYDINVTDGDVNCPTMSFSTMYSRLVDRPLYSVFAFMELAIAVYVWGELLYPSTNCNNISPLSSYYYPLLMTLFDMCKFNLYNANNHLNKSEYMKAIAASLDLYSFMFYTLLTVILGLHFICSLFKLLCYYLYHMVYLPKQLVRGYSADTGVVLADSHLGGATEEVTSVLHKNEQ